MPETIEIREFQANEWRTYQHLRLSALADSPDAFAATYVESKAIPAARWQEHLRTSVQSENDLPLFATVDGDPVGLAWGQIEEETPDVAHLYRVWVAPEERGKGIGKQLLETVIAWARAKNAHCLDLGVTTTNLPAVSLYTSYGFTPIGEPEQMHPGSDLFEQEMRLVLE